MADKKICLKTLYNLIGKLDSNLPIKLSTDHKKIPQRMVFSSSKDPRSPWSKQEVEFGLGCRSYLVIIMIKGFVIVSAS